MDQPLTEYANQLQAAIDAMMALKLDTPPAIKRVVWDNFWQKQSAFSHKIERDFKADPHREREMN